MGLGKSQILVINRVRVSGKRVAHLEYPIPGGKWKYNLHKLLF